MAKKFSLTRRAFLGAAAAVPASAALASCGSETQSDASVPDGATPHDASSATDGSADADAFVSDALGEADAGGEVDAGGEADVGVEVDAFESDALDGSDAGGEAEAGPACEGYPRIDLRLDCGAIGDGVTNDTAAFQQAAMTLQTAGGGELIIPPGTYIVGGQDEVPGSPNGFYQPWSIFKVHNLSCLKISGYGATMRLASGLHYGAFDGAGKPVAGPTTAKSAAAHVGRFFEIVGCEDVLIEGLELDGNSSALVLGGEWGDTGRQTQATGIWLNQCHAARVVDVHTHHHGLDGITVLYLAGPPPKLMPHTLLRVNSEYNGRQGLSWIGGWGLECIDCKFNHTGRTINAGGGVDDGEPLASKPRAGFDNEPNAGTTQRTRDGVFTRCEFINNAGAGILSAVGDGGYTTFEDCLVWGTTSYSLWIRQPGLRFVNCAIYGTAQHASDGHTPEDPAPNPDLATLFEDCTFEDREWTDGKVHRANTLHTTDGVQFATWRNCTFTNHRVRAVSMAGADTKERFEGCTFHFSNATLSANAAQATFRGSEMVGCHFTESAEISAGSRNYCIVIENVTVAASPPSTVDGPRVRWDCSITGTIPPTP